MVTPRDVTAERARIGALIKRKIDGSIVIPCQDDRPVLEDFRISEISTVLVDRAAEGTICDGVIADNCRAVKG